MYTRSTEVDKIHLTPADRRFLRRLRRKKHLPFDDVYDELLHADLIDFDLLPETDAFNAHLKAETVHLTDKYNRYLSYRRDEFFRGRFPAIISVIALVTAIASMTLQALSVLR